jgi:uncharacterized heparinase superfamily protein
VAASRLSSAGSAPRWADALARAPGRLVRDDWFGAPPHLWWLGRVRPTGQRASPRDFRPADIERGHAAMAGTFAYDGLELQVGAEGDPWDQPTPSRAFASQLHRMDWLPDVMAAGEAGAGAALGLVQGWTRVFGRWNAFSWSPERLSRRVFNLSCSLKRLSAQAPGAPTDRLQRDLARQARHLLLTSEESRWAAERAVSAAVAGATLAGPVGDKLLAKALKRLGPALKASVLTDGGHASRSPEAGLELLFDLATLDDALLQLGRSSPVGLVRAIDRLSAALRYFTLPDGRLASFQGGEQSEPRRVIAAAAFGEVDASSEGLAAPPSPGAPYSGYEKLIGRRLQLIIDAAAPAAGGWSVTASAQPLANEILGGADRLITGSGWSWRAEDTPVLRRTAAASTLTLGGASAGTPITGAAARTLGPRLEGAVRHVDMRRHDAETGIWLELSHDGWAPAFGVVHERRLYLDIAADELRGEDCVRPKGDGATAAFGMTQFAVRFHLQPGVRAEVEGNDFSALLLTGPSGASWRLRNDAAEVTLEPAPHLQGGRPRRSSQIVLRGLIRADRTGRIRWKIAAAEA